MEINRDLYMKEYSHYFAIAFAEKFGCDVCLWTDNGVLIHAYAKFCENFYVDIEGAFADITSRNKLFEFTEQNISELSVKDAKLKLHKLNVTYGDTKIRREIDRFLKSNVLTLRLLPYMGTDSNLYGIVGSKDSRNLLCKLYDESKGNFDDNIKTFSRSYVPFHVFGQKGFIEVKS